jgi:membrane protein DedA with SNARE-associated domain
LVLTQGIAHYLLRDGYLILFAAVLAEQIGLPIPSFPVMLAMGALAHSGRYSFLASLGLATMACVLCDLGWYQVGRYRGHKVLNLLCRISLEPDSCVRRTEESFARHGGRSLLFAKFVPGLATAAPSLAGLLRMRTSVFLAWDTIGDAIWAGAFTGAGYLFSKQLERASLVALGLGTLLAVLLAGALAAHIGWKYFQRQRFIRSLRIARITPEELRRKIESGEDAFIVDLRHSSEFEAKDAWVPGAKRMRPEDLEEHRDEIPRDRDIVLYCT